MTEWFTLVSDVGFPVVVTLYLLHRIEAKLDTVVLSIQHLTDEVKVIMTIVRQLSWKS